MNNGCTTTPTPKSDMASPRSRKFAVECKVEERTILIIIRRFPTVAAAETMPLRTTLTSKDASASSNRSNGISITHEVWLDTFDEVIVRLKPILKLCLWR